MSKMLRYFLTLSLLSAHTTWLLSYKNSDTSKAKKCEHTGVGQNNMSICEKNSTKKKFFGVGCHLADKKVATPVCY